MCLGMLWHTAYEACMLLFQHTKSSQLCEEAGFAPACKGNTQVSHHHSLPLHFCRLLSRDCDLQTPQPRKCHPNPRLCLDAPRGPLCHHILCKGWLSENSLHLEWYKCLLNFLVVKEKSNTVDVNHCPAVGNNRSMPLLLFHAHLHLVEVPPRPLPVFCMCVCTGGREMRKPQGSAIASSPFVVGYAAFSAQVVTCSQIQGAEADYSFCCI